MFRFVLVLPVVAAVSGSLVPALKVGNLVARDATDSVCTVAGSLLAHCDDFYGEDDPLYVRASCYCCGVGKADLEPAFKTCEEHISTEYRSEYSAVATLVSFCDSVSADGFSCAALYKSTGSSTPSSTESLTPAVQTTIPGPPACTSLASIIEKCRGEDSDDVASCLCYTNGGYNSQFDAYASQCNDWYASVDPFSDGFSEPTTLCEAWVFGASSYGPAGSSVVPVTGSVTTDALGTVASTEASLLSPTPAATPKTTAGPSTATSTQTPSPTASQAGAGANRAGSGLVAWLAVALPMAML